MKPIKVLGCAVSLAAMLGTALPALAQEARTSFEDFGCVFDAGELEANGTVPAGTFEESGFVGFVTSKNCPGSSPRPAIQLNCEVPLDPDPGITLNTRNFTCTISGAQCGFNQSFAGTNNRLTIQPAAFLNEDNELVGLATIRCSRSVD